MFANLVELAARWEPELADLLRVLLEPEAPKKGERRRLRVRDVQPPLHFLRLRRPCMAFARLINKMNPDLGNQTFNIESQPHDQIRSFLAKDHVS